MFFGKNIRYINSFNKYENIILFEKKIGITSCPLVCVVCIPSQSIDHIFGTVAMGIYKPHMSYKLRTKHIKHVAVNRANPLDQLPSGHQFRLSYLDTEPCPLFNIRNFFPLQFWNFGVRLGAKKRLSNVAPAPAHSHVRQCHPSLLVANTANTKSLSD